MVVVEHDDVLKLDFLNSDFEFLLTFLGFKHHPLEPVPGFGQFSTKKHPRVSPRRFLGFDALCLHKHVTKSLGDSNPTWRSRKNWQRYGKKNTGIVHPPQKKNTGNLWWQTDCIYIISLFSGLVLFALRLNRFNSTQSSNPCHIYVATSMCISATGQSETFAIKIHFVRS